MTEYHKIDSVFKRDQKGNFIEGEWSRPEFDYLQDNPWVWTEKIDGTNIRIMWGDGRPIQYGGRTDNAQIPAKLIIALNNLFRPYAATITRFGSYDYGERKFSEIFKAAEDVVLYGEGYGAGIQKGGGNYSPDQKFILFDVRVGNWWLKREDVEDIAEKLGIDVVARASSPVSLRDMIYSIPKLTVPKSYVKGATALIEGWVGTPVVPLFARNGDRIITKVKYKDFKHD